MIIFLEWIWACGGPSRPKYTAWNWKLATLKLTLILKQIEIEKLEQFQLLFLKNIIFEKIVKKERKLMAILILMAGYLKFQENETF